MNSVLVMMTTFGSLEGNGASGGGVAAGGSVGGVGLAELETGASD